MPQMIVYTFKNLNAVAISDAHPMPEFVYSLEVISGSHQTQSSNSLLSKYLSVQGDVWMYGNIPWVFHRITALVCLQWRCIVYLGDICIGKGFTMIIKKIKKKKNLNHFCHDSVNLVTENV